MAARLWNRPFIQVILMNFMIFVSFQMLNTTLTIYLNSLGASQTVIGFFVATINIGALSMRPFSGRALDRLGRRPLLVGAFVVIAVLCRLYAVFPIIGVLFALRLLHGFAWSLSSTGTSTLAAASIPRQYLGRGMSYYGLSTALSQAIAPAVGLWLIEVRDFGLVSLVTTGIMLASILMGLSYPYKAVETAKPARAAADEGRGKESFFEHSAILPSIMMGCCTVALIAITGFVALDGYSLGLSGIGFFFTLYAMIILAIRPFLGTIIDRCGVMSTLLPALNSLILGLLILGFAKTLPVFFVAAVFCGGGYGTCQTTLQTLAVMNAPETRFGAANATFFVGFDIGIAGGSVLAGLVADAIGYGHMYHVIMFFPLMALALALTTQRKRKA